jgi:hypothetical protein
VLPPMQRFVKWYRTSVNWRKSRKEMAVDWRVWCVLKSVEA